MPQISDLPITDIVNSGDLLIISQGGITKSTTYSVLQSGINTTAANIVLRKSQPTISFYDTDGGSANYKITVYQGQWTFQQIDSSGAFISNPILIDSGAQSLHLKSTGSTLGANIIVTSSSTSTDKAIARFNGLTGSIIQTSGASIDDSGNITATNFSGSSSGTNTGNQVISGTANQITSTATGANYAISISSTYVGQASITTLGTITSGTWNATAVTGQYGGTGVANTGKTITLGGNLTTSGAFGTTITSTNTTTVTLPTTGTLYGTATGSITSAQLAGSLTDETGTGVAVFSTSPTLITPVLGVAAATTINKVTITAPATGSTLTIVDGATLTASATATVSGTNTGDQFGSITANTILANATAGSAAATASITLSASQLAGRGASGNLAPITLGTGLTMSGTTLNASGGSELVLLATATASSSSTLDFTSAISSSYSKYVLVINSLLTSTSASIGLKISTDNGSTWTPGLYSQLWNINIGSTTAPVYTDVNNTTPAVISIATSTSFTGEASFLANSNIGFLWEGLICASGGGSDPFKSFVNSGSGTAINAIRLLPSAGNFTSGTVYLYGVKNT